MYMLLNMGIMVSGDAYNALPVFIWLVVIVVGMLVLAIICSQPEADFNKASGAGMEGPAPSPFGEQLPEWLLGDGWDEEHGRDGVWESPPCRQMDMPDIEDVSCLLARPGLSGRPGPSGTYQEFEEAMQKVAEVAKLLQPPPPG